MILGLGNDIIEVARIKRNLEIYQERFLNRIFTKQEQEYCLSKKEPSIHLAGRFAAKEAVVKAFGTGFTNSIEWVDIEVINDSQGKPLVAFSEKLNQMFNHPHFQLSISHCHEYATAVAIWIKS